MRRFNPLITPIDLGGIRKTECPVPEKEKWNSALRPATAKNTQPGPRRVCAYIRICNDARRSYMSSYHIFSVTASSVALKKDQSLMASLSQGNIMASSVS